MLKIAKKDKGHFVRRMFGRIAGRYDMGNRVLSLGRDQVWRRKAVAMLAPQPHEMVLDIGAGTADLAIELARHAGRVVAADFSRPMLDIGKDKVIQVGSRDTVRFVVSDAMGLPFPDDSFDAVTTAFAVRNFDSLERGFREIRRVLKPGGRTMTLEFTQPEGLFNVLYRPYLSRFLPFIGGRITGDRAAYSYLADSINEFPSPLALARCIGEAGLERVEYHRFNLGTVAVHLASKPSASQTEPVEVHL